MYDTTYRYGSISVVPPTHSSAQAAASLVLTLAIQTCYYLQWVIQLPPIIRLYHHVPLSHTYTTWLARIQLIATESYSFLSTNIRRRRRLIASFFSTLDLLWGCSPSPTNLGAATGEPPPYALATAGAPPGPQVEEPGPRGELDSETL